MGTLTRVLGYLRPYLGSMIAAMVMLALSGALMGAVVSTVKPLVNDVLLQREVVAAAQPEASVGPDILRAFREWLPTDRFTAWARENAFVQVPLLFIVVYFFRAVFGYFGTYFTLRAGACMIRDVRLELYTAVTRQSLRFFQTHATGLILSRILNDIQQLQRVATTSLANGVRVGAMVPFLLVVAFVHEWRMSLLAIVALPLLAWPMLRLGRRLRRAATASQENMADVAHKVSESVGGVKVVQGFGMEAYEIARFSASLEGMLRADLKAGRATSLLPAVLELFGAVIGAGLFFVAGRTIAAGHLDPGNFAVVLFSLGLLFVSVRRLNAVYVEIQHALAGAVRVFSMLDREREIEDLPGATDFPPFSREIRFDSVGFSYGDEEVLADIDLTIAKGEVIALVGASGSGKSTLANLIPRFYDPTRGRILIDGRDVREATLASLRGQIGIVTQETVLFDDTVRNNVAYGRADCPLERIIEVARATQAHEFVERLPEGYDTMLGERGARLSMGQRQRLTIARALLKDPPLLILDEATSALDAESESLVQQALEVLMRGRTSIVIAHRLATVRSADRILVLDYGRVIEQGTHAELLDAGGAYARLCELQFRDQDGVAGREAS
jgi:subfamily B ATP-binding cassette protein MsbA